MELDVSTSGSFEVGTGGGRISKENFSRGLSNSGCNDGEGAILGRTNLGMMLVLDCVVEPDSSRLRVGGVEGNGTAVGSGV